MQQLKYNCKHHQSRLREIFARMTIDQVEKPGERNIRAYRFTLSTGMHDGSAGKSTWRMYPHENLFSLSLIHWQLRISRARAERERYVPRRVKILVCGIMATDLKTAQPCVSRSVRPTNSFELKRDGRKKREREGEKPTRRCNEVVGG